MSEEKTEDLGQKYQTKPTLETILEEMRAGFDFVNKRFDALESRLASFQKEVTHELRIIHDDIRHVRVEQEDLKDRVSELEKHPA
ncbi:MAG TPA: hypothetical protein VLJ61_05715 [Pyrinomonadaceae bacterium]|nr:hypothetical protein [Pyrinomonadaceae bacterium]